MVNRRPKLELVAPSAPHEEAAAIVAALERFMRDHSAPLAEPARQEDPWRRAAVLEGVHRGKRFDAPHPWING